MADMTLNEKILWEYIESESNELLLSIIGNIESDGFDRLSPEGPELVALKIMSAAYIKMLAIITENRGNIDLPQAYLEATPMHVELIKIYAFRALERARG